LAQGPTHGFWFKPSMIVLGIVGDSIFPFLWDYPVVGGALAFAVFIVAPTKITWWAVFTLAYIITMWIIGPNKR